MNSRRFALAALLLGSLPLTGCFEIDQHLTLKKDGSSTVRIQLSVPEKRLEQIKEMPNKKGDTPDELFDEKLFREKTVKNGGAVESFKSWSDKDNRRLDALVALKDPEALSKSGVYGDKGELFFFAEAEGQVRMVIYPQGKKEYEESVRRIAEAEAMEQKEEGKEMAEFQARMFEMQKRELKGLKVAWHFTMPGAIKTVSDGMVVEKSGDTATFSVTDDQLKQPKDMRRLDAMKFEIVFDGKDCKLPLSEPLKKAASQPAEAEKK